MIEPNHDRLRTTTVALVPIHQEYYTSNSGIYEKNYIQTGKNEWLDSKSISWSSSPGGANKRYALKKLKIIKNEDTNHCMTFKRTIAILSAEEYKSLKKN